MEWKEIAGFAVLAIVSTQWLIGYIVAKGFNPVTEPEEAPDFDYDVDY